MKTVNVHEAKTHLSRLIDEASKGEPFVIAKAGKPLVKVVPYTPGEGSEIQRLGFLQGAFEVPEDFDTMGAGEIDKLFGAS